MCSNSAKRCLTILWSFFKSCVASITHCPFCIANTMLPGKKADQPRTSCESAHQAQLAFWSSELPGAKIIAESSDGHQLGKHRATLEPVKSPRGEQTTAHALCQHVHGVTSWYLPSLT